MLKYVLTDFLTECQKSLDSQSGKLCTFRLRTATLLREGNSISTIGLLFSEFIRLGRLDATDEEIEQAMKDSGADEIVKKFPRVSADESKRRSVLTEEYTGLGHRACTKALF